MRKFKIFLLALGVLPVVILAGCENCDGIVNDAVGGQFFTLTYETPNGTNYLEGVYNLSNVRVWLDTTGGENTNLELISPGFQDGKFGPFFYAERFIDPTSELPNYLQLLGITHRFNYHIKKDTFGTDILSVDFLMQADDCHSFWSAIKFSLNGQELDTYSLDQAANIVIVE